MVPIPYHLTGLPLVVRRPRFVVRSDYLGSLSSDNFGHQILNVKRCACMGMTSDHEMWREFSARVKLRMDDLGFTQSDVARRLSSAQKHKSGTSRRAQSGISDWFNPSRRAMPNAETMLLLPGILRCNGHWLLTGRGPMTTDRSAPSDQGTRAEGIHQCLVRLREMERDLERLAGTSEASSRAARAPEEDDAAIAKAARKRHRKGA